MLKQCIVPGMRLWILCCCFDVVVVVVVVVAIVVVVCLFAYIDWPSIIYHKQVLGRHFTWQVVVCIVDVFVVCLFVYINLSMDYLSCAVWSAWQAFYPAGGGGCCCLFLLICPSIIYYV